MGFDSSEFSGGDVAYVTVAAGSLVGPELTPKSHVCGPGRALQRPDILHPPPGVSRIPTFPPKSEIDEFAAEHCEVVLDVVLLVVDVLLDVVLLVVDVVLDVVATVDIDGAS